MIAENKIKYSEDKRLEISGHSLGGGLASAVCCVLNQEFPDISVHGMIFNAAGVHKNTIARALGSQELALSAISCNPAIDFCVRDEVLTTASVNYKKMPLLGAVFNMVERHIGQHGLPPPIATRVEAPGVSAGTQHEAIKNGAENVSTQLPSKGALLPKLFPITEQNAVPFPKPDGFPMILLVDRIFNSAPNIGGVITNALKAFNELYRADAAPKNWTAYGTYMEMWERFKSDIGPELKAVVNLANLSVAYHGMDIVIATFEHYLKGGTPKSGTSLQKDMAVNQG